MEEVILEAAQLHQTSTGRLDAATSFSQCNPGEQSQHPTVADGPFLAEVSHSTTQGVRVVFYNSDETMIESQSKIEYFGHNRTQSKS